MLKHTLVALSWLINCAIGDFCYEAAYRTGWEHIWWVVGSKSDHRNSERKSSKIDWRHDC